MYDYIIATSSTSDLPRTYLEAHNIPFIPYTYTIGNDLYEDDCREETRQKVYEGMRNGDRLKTSMINEYIYDEFFESLLAQGKDVIFLDMSQKMSVSYEKSKIGAKMALEKYPERKLYVMDTLCISGGLGLLVDSMVTLAEGGAGYDEVIAWGEANKLKIAHRFTVDDLNYLKAGGRVSNAAALVGGMLAIKPVLYVPGGGTLEVAKKVRGRKAALNSILDSSKADLAEVDTKGLKVHILQADCRADAEYVRDELKKAYPDLGEITITSLGVVIGAHCGPGLLTVFYLCNGCLPYNEEVILFYQKIHGQSRSLRPWIQIISSTSDSPRTLTPRALSSSAARPSPAISRPVKVPSYITPLPQDGLFSLRSAILQPFLSARLTATSAPLEYSAVTFLPLQLTTAPPRRSLGSRGVGKPPAVSGQTGMSRYFSRSAAIFSAAIALCPPLYLHSTPSRHALISSASFSLIAPTSSCSAP